jgi:hypothetical protein
MKVGINCFLFDFEVEYLNKLHSIHTFSGGDPDKVYLSVLFRKLWFYYMDTVDRTFIIVGFTNNW